MVFLIGLLLLAVAFLLAVNYGDDSPDVLNGADRLAILLGLSGAVTTMWGLFLVARGVTW